MFTKRQITKVGLAICHDGKLLLVRKHGKPSFILPGGKPDQEESDLETLEREIFEELGCAVEPDTLKFLGTFVDDAADEKRAIVTIKLYFGTLVGMPKPRTEIKELKWVNPKEAENIQLAPSLSKQILPFLVEKGELCAGIAA